MPISTIGANGLTTPLPAANLGTPSAINLSNATALPKAALPTGSVLQVVSTYTNAGFTSTTSTSYVATTLSASITPTSSTSKFLIIVTGGVYQGTSGSGSYAVFRNGTNILNNQIYNQVLNVWSTQGGVAYDSPATTSAITYALYMKASSGSTYWGGDSPLTNTLTIMEIAA